MDLTGIMIILLHRSHFHLGKHDRWLLVWIGRVTATTTLLAATLCGPDEGLPRLVKIASENKKERSNVTDADGHRQRSTPPKSHIAVR